jgi:hypothetical protein
VSGRIAAAPGRIAAAPGRIAAVQGWIAAVAGGIPAVQGWIAAAQGWIAAAQGWIAAVPCRIAVASGRLLAAKPSRSRLLATATPCSAAEDGTVSYRAYPTAGRLRLHAWTFRSRQPPFSGCTLCDHPRSGAVRARAGGADRGFLARRCVIQVT